MLHQDAHCNTAGGDYIASPVDQPVHGQQGSGDGPYIISGRKGQINSYIFSQCSYRPILSFFARVFLSSLNTSCVNFIRLISIAPTGCGMHPRLNVCDLANKAELKEQWTLFILAYLEIQRPDYEPKAAQFGKLGWCLVYLLSSRENSLLNSTHFLRWDSWVALRAMDVSERVYYYRTILTRWPLCSGDPEGTDWLAKGSKWGGMHSSDYLTRSSRLIS